MSSDADDGGMGDTTTSVAKAAADEADAARKSRRLGSDRASTLQSSEDARKGMQVARIRAADMLWMKETDVRLRGFLILHLAPLAPHPTAPREEN